VLSEVGAIVRSSHERWDGGGYPDGLAGEEIPVESAIIACADAFDAMTSDRTYRKGRPPDEALEELVRNSGTQFRPDVVSAITEVVEADLRRRGAQRLGRGAAALREEPQPQLAQVR
jgi:HD-GYP domain-containing protein (c-di-GMP phosphodiesterase class II)